MASSSTIGRRRSTSREAGDWRYCSSSIPATADPEAGPRTARSPKTILLRMRGRGNSQGRRDPYHSLRTFAGRERRGDSGGRALGAGTDSRSAFTSARAFARQFGAPAFLVRDPLDTLAAVRRFPGPVLVLHGDHDEVVPFDHGRTLAATSPRATFRPLPCGHNDCARPWAEVRRFLDDHGLSRARADGR